MAESTFAAKRMVCDHVHSVGGIDHVDVGNKQLLRTVQVLGTNTVLSLLGRPEKAQVKGCCR